MPETITHLPAESLRAWVTGAFVATGVGAEDAAQTAAMLVQTSLWGIDSHGIARVPHYLDRLTRGSIVAQPKLRFEATGAATGNLDGGDGLGFVVCAFGMDRAIELARASGAGVVGIRNSSHCGAIGLYSRQAAAQGMIGVSFTHSDSFVIPHGGTQAFFGTNPISIAIPSDDPQRPLCVDMATSVVPINRIMNARRENSPIAPGLGVDRLGQDTTDPHALVALKPAAAHKGYALAFLIDMLCGPLNGMAFGPHLSKMYEQLETPRRLGSLMIAVDPQRFCGGPMLHAVVGTVIAELKQQGQTVLSPGEPEYRAEAARTRGGIPIEPGLWAEIANWSDRLRLPPPFRA